MAFYFLIHLKRPMRFASLQSNMDEELRAAFGQTIPVGNWFSQMPKLW
uniref:Uncharacterized protein n=1 Tax=Triticum urartu TaxID=4572 RepID=A0A8R7U508_TRIUA